MAKAHVSGIAIDCPNSAELCAFYAALLELESVNEGIMIAQD
jgi:hypothetical protein